MNLSEIMYILLFASITYNYHSHFLDSTCFSELCESLLVAMEKPFSAAL